MSAALFDLPARRVSQPRDANSVMRDMADGVSAIDAQIHSLPFQALTEDRLVAIERNLHLLRGMVAELRSHVPAPRPDRSRRLALYDVRWW